MTINLDVYLKKKPNFKGFLTEDVGLELVETNQEFKIRTYVWFPTNRRKAGNHINITEHLKPRFYSRGRYCMDEDIDSVAEKKAREGIILSKDFIKKVKKNKEARADKEMYLILQKYPELERFLEEDQPLWGILKFTQGKPTYRVDFEAKYSASEEVLEGMANLAQFLAIKYDGIMWDEHDRQFEKPDTKKLYQETSTIFKNLISLMDELGFESKPAGPDENSEQN